MNGPTMHPVSQPQTQTQRRLTFQPFLYHLPTCVQSVVLPCQTCKFGNASNAYIQLQLH